MIDNSKSLIENYRSKTLNKLNEIMINMYNDFIEINIEDKEGLIEKRRAIEEIGVYIYHIQNMQIDTLDELNIIISKLYLITLSTSKVIDVLKYMGITKVTTDSIKAFELKPNHVTMIFKMPLYEEEFKYDKSFQFAKELYHRSSNRKLNSKWESTHYYNKISN